MLFKGIDCFILQGCIKLIESYCKDIYKVTKKITIQINCSFQLSIQQRILQKKNIIRIVYNTDKCEDWRNDAE